MSPYPRPGEKVEEKTRTPRDGVEYVPSSDHPSSYSHNPGNPFPNDLLHFPHATTDIHAHVMVCDLIDDEKSVAMIADDWHLTFAQTDHIASLPIVDREVEALKKLVKLRAELMSLVYGDRAIRSLARVANMPLLEPGTREYTESAANARASLVRLASAALLADARRRAAPARSVSSRTASGSERTSGPQSESDSAPPSQPVHPAGALDDLPPASSLKDDADSPAGALDDPPPASSLKDDADSPAGALHDLHPASSLKNDADSAASEGGPSASEGVSPASDVGARVPLVPGEPVRGGKGEAEPVRSVPGAPPSLHDAVSRERVSEQVPSPPRRTAGCHGFQPVENDPNDTASTCDSPPPGRTNSAPSTAARMQSEPHIDRAAATSVPDSSLPSQPVHPAGALHDLPLASSLKDDAKLPRPRDRPVA
jgi:hypothetical protein